MIAQPRQFPGADVGLPGVPLGLFRQAHVLAQQRVHRCCARAAGRGVLIIGLDQEVMVCPRRQGCLHQPSAGVKGGEIDCGAGAMQIREKLAQPMR